MYIMTCPDKRNIENEKDVKPLPYNYNDMMVGFQVISSDSVLKLS